MSYNGNEKGWDGGRKRIAEGWDLPSSDDALAGV